MIPVHSTDPGSIVDRHARPPVRVAKVESLEEDAVVTAAVVDAGAACFHGHYPGYPIFPGVFTVELAHQSMRLFLAAHGLPLQLVEVGCRFLEPILPGATIRCSVQCSRLPDGSVAARAECVVDKRRKATSKLIFAPSRAAATQAPPWSTCRPTMSSGALEQSAIKRLMPHRFPALLLDAVRVLDPDGFVEGVKCITCNEPCFANLADDVADDAYEYPVSLLIESFGQACGVLVNDRRHRDAGPKSELMLAAGVSRFHLFGSPRPGDQLLFRGRMTKATQGFAVFDGAILVRDAVVALVDTMIVAFRSEQDDDR